MINESNFFTKTTPNGYIFVDRHFLFHRVPEMTMFLWICGNQLRCWWPCSTPSAATVGEFDGSTNNQSKKNNVECPIIEGRYLKIVVGLTEHSKHEMQRHFISIVRIAPLTVLPTDIDRKEFVVSRHLNFQFPKSSWWSFPADSCPVVLVRSRK